MIWQNMWALAGLAALALPIAVHLLSRDRARVQRFPSLRFLDAVRLPPTRRTRLSDIGLLVVRCAILAAAVFALAQPLVLSAMRRRMLDAAVARAIIVDTSASMARMTPGGERTLDVARREATRYQRDAHPSIVIETNAPRRAIAGAAAWLAGEAGKRELIVLSDFQAGTLDTADLAVVPADAGIHLARIEATAATGTIDIPARGASPVVARVTASADRTDVEWASGAAHADTAFPMRLLTSAHLTARAMAAANAARAVTGTPPSARGTTIVFPDYEHRAALLAGARAPDSAWMANIFVRIASDSVLVRTSRDAVVLDSASAPMSSAVLARTATGSAVAFGARIAGDGATGIGVFANVDPGSLASAAIIAAVLRAQSSDADATEADPSFVSSASLERWERIASTSSARSSAQGATLSDGRWLWLAALALLCGEWFARRRTRPEPSPEVAS